MTATAAAAGTITVGGDLTVNRMGFGAMRVTGRGAYGEPPDRDDARDVLRRVVELGVNFVDTADAYGPGISEELIAEALHPYPEDLVIATKGGLVRPERGRWTTDGRPEYIKQVCDESLRRLRLDRIDVYQFHHPDDTVPFAESVGAFVDLQAEGKIRHIGLSNVSVAQLEEALRLSPIASVQNRYNLSDRKSDDVLDACEAHGVAFLPWAPIQDLDVPALAEIAGRHEATERQVVLAWLLARSPVMLPIPGTGTVDHLEENVAAAGLELSDDEVRTLTAP